MTFSFWESVIYLHVYLSSCVLLFWWFDMQCHFVVCPSRPVCGQWCSQSQSINHEAFMAKSCILSLHAIVNAFHQIQGLLQLVYILWSERVKELSGRLTCMRSPQPETFTSTYQRPQPLILTDMEPVVLEYIFYVRRQSGAYVIMKQVLPAVINSPHWFLLTFLV